MVCAHSTPFKVNPTSQGQKYIPIWEGAFILELKDKKSISNIKVSASKK